MPIVTAMGRLLRTLALLAGASLTAACATTGAAPRPFPGASLPPPSEPRSAGTTPGAALPGDTPTRVEPSPLSDGVVALALSLRGVPYRNGGSSPEGFDCSGLVQYVFALHGTPLPRATHDQYKAGRSVRVEEMAPGDLVFFDTTGDGVSHVGLAVGADEFVHAPNSRGVVRVERVSSSYWSKRVVGVRRITWPPPQL